MNIALSDGALTAAVLASAFVVSRLLDACDSAGCLRAFAWRRRMLDDGRMHAQCAECARRVDRIASARRRIAVAIAAPSAYRPDIAPRIYVAGPMRGLPEHNFPAFNAAAARFRAAGWKVENPVEIGAATLGNGNPNIPGGEYLRADVRRICECSAIAVLPGWERSTGARAEIALAISIGLAFHDALTMERIAPPNRVVICGGYERPAGAVDTLDAVTEDILAWQRATFRHRTPHSITTHLLKEAHELHAAPLDHEEWADVYMLTVALSDDGSGVPRNLIASLRAKLAKNKARRWGQPDADGVVEHLAEGLAPTGASDNGK